MKKITDKNKIKKAMEEVGLDVCFSGEPQGISIQEYEKGELLMSPLKKNQNLWFLLDGYVMVYQIDENGVLNARGIDRAGSMLGDTELFIEEYGTLFVEARTQLHVLVVPFFICRKEIEDNIPFLHFLIRNVIKKELHHHQIEAEAGTTREKVIFYIRNLCEDQCMRNVNAAVDAIHCSHRQLHRILKNLCEEGVLQKVGKGSYKIS